jgi:hypothetical protein
VLHDYGPGETVELASLALQLPLDQILEDTAEEGATQSTESAPR